MRLSMTTRTFRVNLRTAPAQLVCARNLPTPTFIHRPLDQSDGAGGDVDNSDGGADDPAYGDWLQAVERSYTKAAAYVQPGFEPAYLSHQYLHQYQPTVFAAEHSPLPVNAYATDYHLPTRPYLAPYSTHSNYAAPATVAAPANVAAAAAPVAIASLGDYQSVSPPS